MFFWKKETGNSSSSAAWNKRYREILMFLAGLTLTSVAVFLARSRIHAMEFELRRNVSPVGIVVPSTPISSGEVFSERNLAKKTVPVSGTSGRNVRAEEFELLVGARAKGNIAPGDPILWSDVEEPFEMEKLSQIVPQGRRALTIVADSSSSFSGCIRPGDRIDLLCNGGNGISNQTWIHGIPVISVDRNFNRPPSKDESADISTITVSVTPEEGRMIATGAGGGRLHWFLRNPEEPPERVSRISGKSHPLFLPIEIWKGGIRESGTHPHYGNPE